LWPCNEVSTILYTVALAVKKHPDFERLNVEINGPKNIKLLLYTMRPNAGPSGRAVQGVGLRPFACWECEFESHRGHGCMSLISVLKSTVPVNGLSLAQRSPTESMCVSECVRESSIMRRPWTAGSVAPW